MFSDCKLNIAFNIIEYLGLINIFLLSSFLFIMLFFILILSNSNFIQSTQYHDVVFEASLILLFIFFIFIIISPALITLSDSEIIISPSFIIYSCGYQWAWTFVLGYSNWDCNCDHYVLSSYYLDLFQSSSLDHMSSWDYYAITMYIGELSSVLIIPLMLFFTSLLLSLLFLNN